jgi:hypothetical protein
MRKIEQALLIVLVLLVFVMVLMTVVEHFI